MTVFLSAAQQLADWCPAADVYRTDWGWILKLDLAGVRLEDVQVHISRRSISVSGMRRDCMSEDSCRFYSMEITYSRFHRTIELPEDLEGSKVQMDYRDGLLMIRVKTKESNR